VVFQSRPVSPSPVYPAARVGTPADSWLEHNRARVAVPRCDRRHTNAQHLPAPLSQVNSRTHVLPERTGLISQSGVDFKCPYSNRSLTALNPSLICRRTGVPARAVAGLLLLALSVGAVVLPVRGARAERHSRQGAAERVGRVGPAALRLRRQLHVRAWCSEGGGQTVNCKDPFETPVDLFKDCIALKSLLSVEFPVEIPLPGAARGARGRRRGRGRRTRRRKTLQHQQQR
jgi:hypothetical protein